MVFFPKYKQLCRLRRQKKNLGNCIITLGFRYKITKQGLNYNHSFNDWEITGFRNVRHLLVYASIWAESFLKCET